MSEQTCYLTTAIDYVNAAPHLGHAYEKIATDVMARFARLIGQEVFFLTGTDEHGSKVEKTARERGITPKEHCDEMAAEFEKCWQYLNLTYDRFIRTTDPEHYAVVEHLWRKMAAKGDIYKASYEGLYCTGCENFVTERDLTMEGFCPNHPRKPDVVREENYFFKLSAYKDKLKALLERNPAFVQPDFRADEVRRMIEDIADISVSRSRKSVNWGIPVPDDAEQVIYVWIDALSNYLTGIGYLHDEALFRKYWPADVHVIGKDILRFHALYWPAMLMSAEIELPESVFAHGFININDAKISKSVGNVVSPFTLRDRFELPNPDPIRYYLMKVAAFGQDGGFTEDDFKFMINADLANNLGNLLNRSLNMTNKYFDGKVPDSPHARPERWHLEGCAAVRAAYERNDFQDAIRLILELVDWANKAINDQEPWTLHKEGKIDELTELMYAVLETMRQVAILLSPVCPTLSDAIWTQLGYPVTLSEMSPRWSDLDETCLPPGQKINLQGPIMPRLESEIVGAGKKK